MKYLCLIYEAEKATQSMPKEELAALYKSYMSFTEDVKASGHYIGGNPLQPVHTATTVRVRGGQMSTTDGPFAETTEQLGGYYLIEAPDHGDIDPPPR